MLAHAYPTASWSRGAAAVPLVEASYRRAYAEMPDELCHQFQQHDLTARHGAVLAQRAHGQSPSVGELSSRLGLGLSTVSEMVGDLSRAGLVDRFRDLDNRRRVLVALSTDHQDTMRVSSPGAPLPCYGCSSS